MVKNNKTKPTLDEPEIDAFTELLGDDAADILITSEEAITITLFEDEPLAEGEEDDFESNIFSNVKKKKKTSTDKDNEEEGDESEDDNDFDSYFFEEN